MGLRVGSAFVDILPKLASGFAGDIDRAVSGPAEQTGKKAGGLLGGALGKAAAAAGGLFVAKQAFDFLGSATAAARESNKVSAQTEAVIRSTGGAASLTAKQFGSLATAISNKTGVDDEQIQSAENLLATFTNIQDRVGKGNDIFSRATAIATDMGAALKNGPAANAILLGKALNDPIKGISALTRVGVSFTDQQKDQIKAMQEAGDTAGAQKVILAELAKEFGGSAAAQATASDRLKVTLGNLQESLGNKLVPIVDKVATLLADKLPGALDAAGRAGSRLAAIIGPIVKTVALGVAALVAAFRNRDVTSDGFVGAMERIGATARALFDRVVPVLKQVGGFIQENLQPLLIGLGVVLAAVVIPAFVAWAAATLAATWPFLALAAAVVGLIVLFNRFPIIGEIIGRVVDKATELFGSLVAYVQEVWPQISEAIGHVMAVVQGIIETVLAVVSAIWRVWGDDILRIVGAVFGVVKATVENALALVRNVIKTVLAVINGDWGEAWEGLKGIVGAVLEQVKDIISGAFGVMEGLFGGIADTLGRAWSAMWEGIKSIARAAFEWVATHVLNPLIDGINTAVRGLNIVNPGKDVPYLKALTFDEPPDESAQPPTGPRRGFHSGGIVPGAPGEDVPAVLRAGEFVAAAGNWQMLDQQIRGLRPSPPAGRDGELQLVGHLEVKGQADPPETAREIVRELRKLVYLSGI